MEKNNQKKQVIDKNKRVRKANKNINEDTNKNRKEMVISLIAIILIVLFVIILAVVNNKMNQTKNNENLQGKTVTKNESYNNNLSKEEQEKIDKANEMIEITPEILKEKLEKGENMLLDFHATWCEPCKLMKPEIAKALENGVKIYKIDIDKYRETAIQYGVRVMPTLIAIKDKKVFKTVYGYQGVEKIQSIYNEIK